MSSSSTSSSGTTPSSPPSSTAGSSTPSRDRVGRVAVVTHDDEAGVEEARARLERVAAANDVEIVGADDVPELAVTLGGDGSMLRAFHRFLDSNVPVIGVNFGRVGFLTSIPADDLERGLERVFAGDFRVVELPTLEARLAGESWPAVNDVAATSSTPGRMVELAYAVGDEDLGVLPCDGVICSTPSGSTAYNLSNGGPVLVWGLDALAITFVAPHSLQVRPLVVPRDRVVTFWNRTARTSATVIVDGQEVGRLDRDDRVDIVLGERMSLLATLPEVTFFRRYRQTFAS